MPAGHLSGGPGCKLRRLEFIGFGASRLGRFGASHLQGVRVKGLGF